MLSKGLGPAWVPSMTKYEKMVDHEGLAPLDLAPLKHKNPDLPQKVDRECSAPAGENDVRNNRWW